MLFDADKASPPVVDLASRPLLKGEISIEIAPEQVGGFAPDPHVFPKGSRVFLTHIKGKRPALQVDAVRRLLGMGYVPVPHLGARNFESDTEFTTQIAALSMVGVSEALFVGGNPLVASGPLSSASQLLAHSAISDSTIRTAFIGGYPEGHPTIPSELLQRAMQMKLDLCHRRRLAPGIVSQFAFDGAVIADWARHLHHEHPGTPVRIGLAGVTSLSKLIRFAALCGVGPSLAAMRRSAGALLNVLADRDPGAVIASIQAQYPHPIAQLDLHFFPFGGWKKTLDWIRLCRDATSNDLHP